MLQVLELEMDGPGGETEVGEIDAEDGRVADVGRISRSVSAMRLGMIEMRHAHRPGSWRRVDSN